MNIGKCANLQSCSLFGLLEVTRRLSATVDLKEILAAVITEALKVLRADRGTVFIYDGRTEELYSQVATGENEIRFSAKSGIAGETAQKRELINVPDCYSDSRFNQEIDRKTGYRTRCLLSIPLIGIEDQLVGVLQVLNKQGGIFTMEDEQLGLSLASQCAVAIQRALLIEERLVKQKMERDLAVARDIQLAVLPKALPSIEGYDLACWSRPADETGGDIYDAVGLGGNGLAILLGDATGHGIGPALTVTQMRSMFRIGLRLGGDFDAIAERMNDQLKEDLPGNRFITSFIGKLDGVNHKLHYHSFGQGPLIHFHAGRDEVEFLEASALPMGLRLPIRPEAPPPMELEKGDIVALISDGFFEFADPSGEQFEKQRVAEIIRRSNGQSMSELLDILIRRVAEFAQGSPQDDDMTAVLLKRN